MPLILCACRCPCMCVCVCVAAQLWNIQMSAQPHSVSVIETAGVGLRWPVLNIDSVTTTCPTRLIKAICITLLPYPFLSPSFFFFSPPSSSRETGSARMSCNAFVLAVQMQKDVMSRLFFRHQKTQLYACVVQWTELIHLICMFYPPSHWSFFLPLLPKKSRSLKKYLGKKKGLSDDTDRAFLNRTLRPWTLISA